jgi:hypothetical protein
MIKKENNNLISYLPPVLYHATYKQKINKIKLYGLDNTKTIKAWDDSKLGTVYLSTDPNVAASYAEASDKVPDPYLDNIVILHIDTAQLDLNKLNLDENVIDNKGDTIEYNDVIPYSSIITAELYP